MPRIAVIVTTYNWPQALVATLEGYLAQSHRDFELVVADDGSDARTREVVEQYRARADFALNHVWHEDRGNRAAAIRNKALAATGAPYVVFTDHDSVPRPDFLARHARLAEPGWFVSGNRVLLSPALTQRVLIDALPIHTWTLAQWTACRARGEINRLLPVLTLPLGPLRKLAPMRWRGAKTCNLAAWRSDLDRVNGLDESYAGWGLEDTDLVVRLLRAGVHSKSGRYACPVLHLWHREQDRGALAENARRLREVLASDRIVAAQGLAGHR